MSCLYFSTKEMLGLCVMVFHVLWYFMFCFFENVLILFRVYLPNTMTDEKKTKESASNYLILWATDYFKQVDCKQNHSYAIVVTNNNRARPFKNLAF